MSETELLPCPFCSEGGAPWIPSPAERVHCSACGADGPGGRSQEARVRNWNTRQNSNTALINELVEALEAMVVVMDRGGQPRKLDEALTWRQNDEKARAMAAAALAKAKEVQK